MSDIITDIMARLRADMDAALARSEAETAELLRQLEAKRNALRETKR